jgi:hypothetical protein
MLREVENMNNACNQKFFAGAQTLRIKAIMHFFSSCYTIHFIKKHSLIPQPGTRVKLTNKLV